MRRLCMVFVLLVAIEVVSQARCEASSDDAAAVAIYIDKSQSMRPEGLAHAVKIARDVISALHDEDLVAVYGFDQELLPLGLMKTLGPERRTLEQRLSYLAPAGRTDIVAALKSGILLLKDIKTSKRTLVFITDGVFADRSMQYDILNLFKVVRHEGIKLSFFFTSPNGVLCEIVKKEGGSCWGVGASLIEN